MPRLTVALIAGGIAEWTRLDDAADSRIDAYRTPEYLALGEEIEAACADLRGALGG